MPPRGCWAFNRRQRDVEMEKRGGLVAEGWEIRRGNEKTRGVGGGDPGIRDVVGKSPITA